MKREAIVFKNGELELQVEVSPEKETVWLSLDQMAQLFDKNKSTVSRHIRNIFVENELEKNSVVANFATTAKDGKTYKVDYYNLDVIISVGYRIKSQRGIEFRKWASSVLKDYLIKGYALNEKRLKILNRVVEIQSNMLADVLDIQSSEIMKVIEEYTLALELLDDYDHQKISKPKFKIKETSRITYEECRKLIDSMSFSETSNIFGKEKSEGALKGIIDSVYQSAFGEDAYPTIQEKSANLLYFVVKDHPFIDGCKRIAASIFLYFLQKNNILFKNGKKIINDSTLVAITLLLAESRPDEKEIMISVIMNFLNW